jgi:hypothetical protein
MMAVKFNIGFTIDAETLFSIVSKFLPLENLSIEEVVERPERHSAPRVSKVAAMLARADTPKIKRRQRQNAGVNGGQLKVIADHLRANGPASHSEIGYALKAAGFSKLGAGSALKRMLDQGVIRKHERGYALNVSALSA